MVQSYVGMTDKSSASGAPPGGTGKFGSTKDYIVN